MENAETPIAPKTSRLLFLFSFAMFLQLSTALAVVGSLGAIGATWHITPAASALLVTAFGLTVAVSAPVFQMVIGHWVRRSQILIGLSLMALGAAAFALAPNYATLVVARIVMGLGGGLISPVLLALGSTLVKPHQQGAALATISMGISVATVVGVPAASWIAVHSGPRILFWGLAALLALTAAWIAFSVGDRSRGERVSVAQALPLLGTPSTLTGLLVIFFITSGIFATYTLITPVLRDVYGLSARGTSLALLVFGLSGLTGNLFVRRASSIWSAEALLRSAMIALIAVFAGLLSLPPAVWVVMAAMIAWPFFSDMAWPSQQRRMVELQPAFRGLALALSSSFLTAGMAFGSAVGGAAYTWRGYPAALVVSIALMALGLAALTVSIRARAAVKNAAATPAAGASSPSAPLLATVHRHPRGT